MKRTLLSFVLCFIGLKTFATTFFVSVNGNDQQTGRSPKTALRTIQAAVNHMQAGDTCYILAGVYRETVTFKKPGTADRPIVLLPYQGQQVVVTGLDPVSGWKSLGKGQWQTQSAWSIGRGKGQLFYRGEVMLEARYPNVAPDSLRLPVSNLSKLQPTFGDFNVVDSIHIAGAAARGFSKNHWQGAMYYGVHYNGWAAQSAVVESSDENGLTVGNRNHRWWWFKPQNKGGVNKGRGMLIGHRNALDVAGEWVFENNNQLTFISPDGKSPEGVAEWKRRQLAFDFTNSAYIVVKGIDIKAASITLKGAEHCTLESCKIHYVSHFTIFDDARNGEINKLGDRSPLTNGEAGIYVSGSHNRILNCDIQYSAGGGIYLDGHSHVIHNNLISECSYTCTYLAGIMLGFQTDFLSGGHTITHNTIRYSGRALLHFDGSLSPRDGQPAKFAASLIAHNHLHDGMLQGRDGGVVNSYSTDAGAYNNTATQFVNNVLNNCYDPMPTWAGWDLGLIYWDNNTWNLHSRSNLLTARPGSVQKDHIYNAPSVNALWENGKFLPEYTGSIDHFNLADFPGGQPFAFGYNRQTKPPVPTWQPQVVARFTPESQTVRNGATLLKQAASLSGAKSVVVRYRCDEPDLNQPKFRAGKVEANAAEHLEMLVLEPQQAAEKSKETRPHWTVSRFTTNGGYLRFNNLNFGEGYRKLTIYYASDVKSRKGLEIRLDSLNGPVAMTVDLPYGESDHRYSKPQKILFPFVPLTVDVPTTLTGRHTIYVVFRGEDNVELAQLRLIRFDEYRGESTLRANEAQLEIRADKPDGPVLARFYPHQTGGRYRESCVNLQAGDGSDKRDLYLVYRGPQSSALQVESVQFEKGQQTQYSPKTARVSDLRTR